MSTISYKCIYYQDLIAERKKKMIKHLQLHDQILKLNLMLRNQFFHVDKIVLSVNRGIG